jgi:putative flippase GtrA
MSNELTHIARFAVVGTIGFIINTLGLLIGVKVGLRPSIAGPLGAEVAILSNFILNNFWTFSDRSITSLSVIPWKFVQFNLLSFAAVLIQFTFLRAGEFLVGGVAKFKQPLWKLPFLSSIAKWGLVKLIFKLPLVGRIAEGFSAYLFVYVASVGVGMVVNYLVYSLIIWK